MSYVYLNGTMKREGGAWYASLPAGQMYDMPPERKSCCSSDLIGDADLTDTLNVIRARLPYLHISFQGGMTFEGKPLWLCTMGMTRFIRDREEPVLKTWYGEASDKARALQKALDDCNHYFKMLRYYGDNGMLLV